MNSLQTYLNEIETNIKNNNVNNILNYNIKNIIEYDIEFIELFIYNIIQIIEAKNIITHKTFKLDYFGPLIDLIIRLIKNRPSINLKSFNYSILKTLSYYKKGNYFLDMIKDNIIKLNMKEYEYMYIINETCLKGSLPTFLFWFNLNKNNNNFPNYLLNSITNSDDRILKYILRKYKLNLVSNSLNSEIPNILDVNDDYIIGLLTKLFSAIHIPQKYKLKRIKLLSFEVELKKFFNCMILTCNDIQLILKLSKFYYYDEINFTIFLNFFEKFTHYYNYFIEFYNILKTDKEKNIFVLLLHLNHYNNYNLNFVNYNKYIDLFPANIEIILIENYKIFLNKIHTYHLFSLNTISNTILKFYIKNNFISKYLDNNNIYIYNNNYLFYTKYYYNEFYGITNLIINKTLFKLRCLCKKKYRLKTIKKKILLNPIINEINNYKPNNILKNGSLCYQLNRHKFNFIPPRHLLPHENLNKEYLIKEKSDGILVNTIPPNICPFNNEILHKQIKAEYIEELDLYLIFDINIPNTTIFERHLFLRSLHSHTNNNYKHQIISNMDNLVIEINKERENLINFLNTEGKNKIKWYPKMFWKININKLYPDMIKFIEECNQNFNNNIINVKDLYKNDGFILTPLDGSREIKIKPKSLMTIDLLCSNNLEEFTDCKINKIYRCYPNDESKFIPKEIRFDKTKPNTKEIIDCIKNIYNHNWLNLNYNTINYYKKPININDNNLIKLLENQKKIFITILKKLNPEYNKNWLDLGCGQCKFYEEIKIKYLPNKYIGLDNDVNVLSKSLKYVNEKENIFYPCPVDLNKNWSESQIKWYNFDHITFDYIFANYSLSHFFSEYFFEQLNKYTKKNTKFLFNLVKPNSEWLYKCNYLQSDDKEVIINFDWISYSNVEKIYIDLIPEYCKKFGWELLDKFSNNENNLAKCYYWYLLIKL